MGFYEDPYSDFGRLSSELWRACRLVVDTGIHSGETRWTRAQAIDYLSENTPNAVVDIGNSVERYIVDPGQATAYKVGMARILVREDPKNRDLLYAGTEFGLFISLDGGRNWERFMNNYPTVRTDDIHIHPRDGDLIAATHGRSIWIADDITSLQQLTPAVTASDAHLFDVRPAVAYIADIRLDVSTGGEKQFEGENPQRGTAIQFHIKAGVTGDAKVTITDASGRELCETTMSVRPGIHRVQWTLVTPMLTAGSGRGGRGGGAGGGAGAPAAPNPAPAAAGPPPNVSCGGVAGGRGGAFGGAQPGSYVAKLSVGGKEYVKPVAVLEDRWKNEP
jgi:hypothetical protein